jgi:hypothetical protein
VSWVRFVQVGMSKSGKTTIHAVTNTLDYVLGEVRYRPSWRRYVFAPLPRTQFDPDCLRDIAAFCELRTRDLEAHQIAVRRELKAQSTG